MYTCRFNLTFFVITVFLVMSGEQICQSEEVILRDGTNLKTLVEFQNKRLTVDNGSIGFIRYPQKEIDWNWGHLQTINILEKDTIQGEILELNEKELILKTKWNPKLSIPRNSLTAINAGSFGQLRKSIEFPKKIQKIEVSKEQSSHLTIFHLNDTIGECLFHFQNKVYQLSQSLNEITIKHENEILIREKRHKGILLVVDARDKPTILWLNNRPVIKIDKPFVKMIDQDNLLSSLREYSPPNTKRNRCTILKQDRLVLSEGDELFGNLVSIKNQEYEFRIHGLKLLREDQVSGVDFKHSPKIPKPTSGEHIRLRVASWNGQVDSLMGLLQDYSEKKIRLYHEALGEIDIPKEYIKEMECLFFGDSIPLSPQVETDFTLKERELKKAEIELITFDEGEKAECEVWLNGGRIARLILNNRTQTHIITIPLSHLKAENQLEIRSPYQEGKIPKIIQVGKLVLRVHRN